MTYAYHKDKVPDSMGMSARAAGAPQFLSHSVAEITDRTLTSLPTLNMYVAFNVTRCWLTESQP